MGKVTAKDIMKSYEERNSARSVQSSSASNRKVTAADIMGSYEKKKEQNMVQPTVAPVRQTTLKQQNQDYATRKLDLRTLAQEKAIEDYNANMQMYKAFNGLNTADGLVGAGDRQALEYYKAAEQSKNNSKMSEREFMNYAKNWDVLKDLEKSKAYDEKKASALKNLTLEQQKEINQYNLSMQQYETGNIQNAALGLGLNMQDYENASAVKREFMSKYGISSEDFDKYAQYAQESQDRKNTKALQRDIQEDIKENPVGAGILYTGLDILTSPMAGLMAAGETLKSFGYADKDAPVNTESYLYALQNIGATAEEQVLEEIDNPVGDFAYNVGVSTAKSAMGLALGSEPLTLASFGASAYSSALKNAQDKGISKERAMVSALGAGAAEIAFEKLSLDHLYDMYKSVGKTALKNTVLNVLVQSGIEGSEEVFTELANSITDNVVNGQFSDYGMNIRNYQAQGLSAEDARKQANIDAALQVGESFLAGLISGGVMGGTTTAVSKINYHNLGQSVNQDADTKSKVIKAAQAMDESTTAKEIVANTKAEEITDEQMGQIIESMAEVDQKNETDVVSQIFSIAPVQESNAPESTSNALERVDDKITENHTERNHGVTKATLPRTNEQVIALKFDEVSKNTATVRLGNDTVVPLSEVQMNDRTMQQLYNFASTMENTKAANAMLDRYAGQPMEVYARACAVFYNAGQLKTASFDEMVQNSKNAQLVAGMGDTATLYQMFELGRNAASNIAPVQQNLVTKGEFKEGVVIDNRTDKSESRLLDLYTLVAKRTGLDIELNDNLEHGARGNFTASLGKIALSNSADNQYEVLTHELMEYASTYNPQKMQEVYDEVLTYAMSDMGAEKLTQSIKAYQNAYEKVEHGKTFQSASEEYVNDYLAGIFSTPEGVQEFVDFMTKENVPVEQQRSILQTVADFFKELAKKINQYIEEHMLSDAAKIGLRADAKQAQQIRQTVLSVLEDTIGSERKTTDTEIKNSLNVNFASEVDAWYNDKESYSKTGGFFKVGRTSEALKSIGVKEQNIIWDKSKIVKILNDHPEIDIDVIKKVPEVIENPIIVMQSKTRLNSITLLGEVSAKNEQPVLVAMQLKPEGKTGRIVNMIKIASTYARNDTQGIIDTSDILYVEPNKNRTDNWLRAFGLQLPVGLTNYGSINKVTYYDEAVNKAEKENSEKTAFEEALKKAGIKTTTKKSLDVKISENGYLQLHNPELNNEEATETFKIREAARGDGYIFIKDARYIQNTTWQELAKITGEDWKILKEKVKRYEKEPYGYTFDNSYTAKILTFLDGKLYKKDESYINKELHAEEAEKYFGITRSFDKAGYLDINGKLLDFSQGMGYRVQDHREISDILELDEDAGYSDGLIQFMAEGNIRMQSYGIDISVEPNSKQIPVLREFFRKLSGEVTVDFSRLNGDTIGSAEYREGTAPSRILNDIDSFFETGKVPEGNANDLMSLRLSLDVDLMSILEEEYSKEEQDSASIIEEGFTSLQNVHVDKKTMHKMAYKLKKEYKSAYSIDDLTDNLTNVFAYLKDHPDAKYEDMIRIMKEVARPVIEESTDVDTWEKAMYDNFRSYFKGKTIRLNREQVAEVAHYYGSFENFRRQNFGSINFSAKNGTYLDSIWEELVQQSNYMLESDTYSADQPIALVDTLHALKPVKKNIYGMNTEQASYDLALDIFRQFFVEQAQEKANEKVTKKALRLVERQQEYRKTVRKEFNEAVARLREYDKEKRENLCTKYQLELNDAKKSMYAAVKDHDKDAAKKYEKMEKFYQEQIRLLNQENNEKILAIKASNRQNMANRRAYEEQKRVRERIVRNAKGIINYFNTNTDKRHVPEALKTPIAQFITSIDFISEKANPNSAATLAWQDSLNLMYRRLTDKGQASENGYEDVYAALNGENGAGDVLKDMSAFLDKCSGKRVTDLSVRELEWLDGIITALKRAITDINRLYVNKRTQSVAELGTQSIQELLEKKDKKAHAVLVEKGMNVMDANMLDSRSYFDRLGEAAFSIYDELRTAFNNRVWLLKEAQDYMTNALDGLDVKEWTGEKAKVHDFVINGQHLQMTTAQIMSLYELNKRNQAKLHMTVGGIRPTIIGKGSKQIKRVTAVKLTSRDIDTICNTLTAEQKEVADKIQKFLADNCAKWGNKASMQMYGYERFGAKNYFPIRTDGNTVDTKDDSKFWFTKNQGFTKETVKNASNPLIVSDIFEVFTKHVTDMASYSTYSAAMMDAMKWYNFRSTDLQGDVVVYDDAVKTQIERVYGNTYLEYFKKLIEDINAENKRGIESEIAELLTSNMKAASVGANLRVAIQQPTAYLRAAAVIDPKYLSKAVFKKSAMKKAKEHSAITLWKSWGYFETSIGRSMQNVLTGQKTWKEKTVDTSMAMAQFMDDFTWGYLWNACELEISDKHKNVKYDSPEYLELVSKRFDEVVDQTQVVDTVLHKSHIMRSKNLFNKMVTSFMSEPTKSYNLLMNKVRDVYEAKTEAKKTAKKVLKRAVNAYIVTQILNAAVVSIIDAFRDWDEDDKTFVEKYLKNFKENVVDNINPLNMIPYVKDLLSIAEGYDVNRQDMQGMSTLINGGRKVTKYVTDEEYRGKHTLWEVCKELIKGGSQVYGAPAYNPIRDIESIWNTLFPDMRIGGRIYSKTEDYNNLLDGLMENDKETYDRAHQDLIDKGMEEDDIPGKIVSKMKERYEEGTLSKEDAEKLMIEELNYDENDAWFKTNREWEYGSKYGLLYSNIDYAFNTGNTSDRRAIETEINELLKHGVEKSDIAAGITRKYKEEYLEKPSANLKNLLLTCYMYCGYTRDEAMEKIKKWTE